MEYDLAIVNATVVDGRGESMAVADVGIRGDRIERVGSLRGAARRVIDGYGRVLAPGFVDFHGHSDYSLLLDPLARSKIFQGVTTEVGGNCGYHAAPVFGQVLRERRDEYQRSSDFDPDWSSSAQYRAALEAAKPAINYAQQIGYNTLRSAVTSDHARPLSSRERDELSRLVRNEFREGAVGLSFGLAYAPACFSRMEELIDAAVVTAEMNGFVSFHLRNEDETLLESIAEAIEICKAAGARIHIGHLKTFRRPNWHKIDRVLEMLEEARSEGLDLSIDRYPHLAMNTQFKFILPTWALEGGAAAMRARLLDQSSRRKITEELERTVADEVREVLISLVANAENKHLEGRFLDEIAAGRNPWEVTCDLLASEGDAAFATFFGMCAENLDRILQLPYAIVASDASVQAIDKQAGGGRPHPRCFDTFPYFLAEWVNERGRFSLPAAIHRITQMPAKRAGLSDRGTISEGAFADLVLFDPAALSAQVSFEEPIAYPPGIESVIVNGNLTIDGGRHTGTTDGRILSSEDVRA